MHKGKRIALLILAAALLGGGIFHAQYAWIRAKAEASFCTCYVMCKSYVNVRRTPDKRGQEVGYLECGDWFNTDADSKNGYIRVYGIGEFGEGWIYCGFVVTEEPKRIDRKCAVSANGRVACRRWMGGPKTENPWITSGTEVMVYCAADGWALTSRGYIRSEYLEGVE